MAGAFDNFPYSNFHELNLDWIIEQLKTTIEVATEAYTPSNPPPYPVTSVEGQTGDVNIDFPVSSVNGQTGAVSLYAVHDGVFIKFPDASGDAWNVYRLLDSVQTGLQFNKNGAMQRIAGTDRITVYDAENQPPYPVSSVNGQTGAVVLYNVVDSENGIHIQLPDALTKTGWSLRRMVQGDVLTGLQMNKDGALQRINGNYLYTVYDSANQPPYPVTSVNGQTGAVVTPFASYSAADDILTLSVPSTEAAKWGLARGIGDDDEELEIYFEHDEINNEPTAYIKYTASDGVTTVTRKLLTPGDIPSSSGVVSVNGQSGVVTLDGTGLYVDLSAATPVTIEDALAAKQDTLSVGTTMDGTPTENSTKPVSSGGVYTALSAKQNVLSVPTTMDSTPTDSSTKPVTSGGVYTALGTKQDTLSVGTTMDGTPTENSTKPVSSGGVYTALSNTASSVNNKDLAQKQTLAFVSTDGTAPADVDTGEFIYWNGTLYRATADMLSGASLNVNTNVEAVSGSGLSGGLNALNSNIETVTNLNNLFTPNENITLIGQRFTVNNKIVEYMLNFTAVASGTVSIGNISTAYAPYGKQYTPGTNFSDGTFALFEINQKTHVNSGRVSAYRLTSGKEYIFSGTYLIE